jgi:hypothetical protein
MYDRRNLFDFMLDRVKEVGIESGLKSPQAFGKWFATTYFSNPQVFSSSDGSGDGKVDSFFQTNDGRYVQHYVLNTKFTEKFEAPAPVSFYDEITRFWQAFANKTNRTAYLANAVRTELRSNYRKLFSYYDDGKARLFFVTNHRKNDSQYQSIKRVGVQIFHLEDLLQFTVDYIEDAMPRTPAVLLRSIGTILSADKRDTTVPTSIVFARLIDLIRYMHDEDPFDLLFARNIRLKLPHSKVNPSIAKTFQEHPTEFAFSNNGITMLCESHSHDPGKQELTIHNPRVVNGSQTLHSIRDVAAPSATARVMLRIIQIQPPGSTDFSHEAETRREIVEKISIRSNLQNPIKKWNLISTDIYQHDLARFFRKKKLYYERRDGEWSQRRTELKSVGIQRGPHIKALTQLIASYYWDKKLLGPVIAKRGLGELFEDKPYETIRKTNPELVYQIYLLGDILDSCMREHARRLQYVIQLANYVRLALFALVVKALQATGARFGEARMTRLLEEEGDRRVWLQLTKSGLDIINAAYKKETKRYRAKTGKDLTLANFSKAQGYTDKILSGPLPQPFRQLAKRLQE